MKYLNTTDTVPITSNPKAAAHVRQELGAVWREVPQVHGLPCRAVAVGQRVDGLECAVVHHTAPREVDHDVLRVVLHLEIFNRAWSLAWSTVVERTSNALFTNRNFHSIPFQELWITELGPLQAYLYRKARRAGTHMRRWLVFNSSQNYFRDAVPTN